jgi:hypothetical protein
MVSGFAQAVVVNARSKSRENTSFIGEVLRKEERETQGVFRKRIAKV